MKVNVLFVGRNVTGSFAQNHAVRLMNLKIKKMDYKKYIDLGFVRTDMNDQIEFNQTGFGGFSLEKQFKKGLSICVSSTELQNPHLYVKKRSGDTYHIMRISEECVVDICHNNS
jgi:hypothetical protein